MKPPTEEQVRWFGYGAFAAMFYLLAVRTLFRMMFNG